VSGRTGSSTFRQWNCSAGVLKDTLWKEKNDSVKAPELNKNGREIGEYISKYNMHYKPKGADRLVLKCFKVLTSLGVKAVNILIDFRH